MKSFNIKKYSQIPPAQIANPTGNMATQMQSIIEAFINSGWNTDDIEGYVREMTNLELVTPQLKEMGESIEEAQAAREDAEMNAGVPGYDQGDIGMEPTASKKVFNLKKSAQPIPDQPPMDDMGLNDSPEVIGDELQMQDDLQPQIQMEQDALRFQDGNDLRDWLNQRDFTTARSELIGSVSDINTQQVVEDSLGVFYEGSLSENDKLKLSASLFELLPDNLKEIDPNQEGNIIAPYVKACVEETNEIIKNLAKEKFGKKEVKKTATKSFNLKKTAQHEDLKNVIVQGPKDKPLIDPFYRLPVSDFHIIERNKGFGQDIGGIWNIDYEVLWRTHIMDKYSRPYRDKDGNWVGGYIQKRFEVDKNIPVASNMQLKPGQKRKPRLPQYGVTEARLQEARSSGTVVGGPNIDRSKPFNWKEASQNKKARFGVFDTKGPSICKDCGYKSNDLSSVRCPSCRNGEMIRPDDDSGWYEHLHEKYVGPLGREAGFFDKKKTINQTITHN